MNDKPTGKDYVGSDDLYADVQRTMRLCAEMNMGYHTEAEVRDCLREITRSEVSDNMVVAGSPARVIREIKKELNQ